MKKRAITDREKKKKRQRILKAAWAVFEENEGRLPLVSRIAKQAGISKGTIYLYFKTKEEIFLNVYIMLLEDWLSSLEQDLRDLGDNADTNTMALLFTSFIVEKPNVMKLGSLVRSVFEESMDHDTLMAAKLTMARLTEAAGKIAARSIPGASEERGGEIVLWIYSLLTGLWQHADRRPEIARQIRKQGLTVFDLNFKDAAVRAVEALIRGCMDNCRP